MFKPSSVTDLGGGYLRKNLEVKDDHLIRGIGEGLEEDREDVVNVLEHLHGDLNEEVVDPPDGGDLAGCCALCPSGAAWSGPPSQRAGQACSPPPCSSQPPSRS